MWVPLAFVLFRHTAPNRTAFSIALIVMMYLFAFIHTIGSGDGVEMLLSTLLMGTLFALPVSAVCLYRNLETGIGFHFWMDFVKYGWAFLIFDL